jgi:hypothetical protein
MKRNVSLVLGCCLLLLLAACSSGNQQKSGQEGGDSASTPAAPPAPKTEAITGRLAFQKMYQAARTWTPDAQGFRLESQPTADASGVDGKSAVWRARFGSARKTAAKPIMWAGSVDPDAPARGLSPGGEDSYNPSNFSTRPFDIAFLRTDSDKAFEIAQKRGGKKLLDKDPKTPVRYLLNWDPQRNTLVWHVSYGEKNPLRISVNASTGEFIRVEK